MSCPLTPLGSRGYYKPFALRTLVLFSLLLITLTLICLTELAIRTIPQHTGIGALANAVNGTFKRSVKRDTELGEIIQRFESIAPILSFHPIISFSTSSTDGPTFTPTGGFLTLGGGNKGSTSATPSIVTGGWLSVGDGTGSLSSSQPSQPTISINNPVDTPPPSPTPPPAVGSSDQAVASGPPTAAPPNGPENPVLKPTVGSSPDAGTPTLAGPTGTNMPLDSTETPISDISLAVSSTDSATASNTNPSPVIFAGNGNTFSETPNPVPAAPEPPPTPITVVSNGKTYIETPNNPGTASNVIPAPIIVVSNGKTYIETPSSPATNPKAIPTPIIVVSDGQTRTETPSAITASLNPNPLPIVFVSDGKTFTEDPMPTSIAPTGTITGGVFITSSVSADKPIATVVNSTGTFYIWQNGDSTIPPQIDLQQYVLVTFVPLILAVLYTIPWRIVDRTIRETEPFYQMHQKGGALAENSLCLDYTTSNGFTTPFKAVLRGHFYMFWSSLISLAVVGIAPLSSEALFVSLSGPTGPDIDHLQGAVYATWGVYPDLARAIEGLLAFVAVLTFFMIVFGLRRETGVYSEPLSIAGLATLFHSSPLLRGFREIDSRVRNSELKKILAGQRYAIRDFTTMDHRDCYGLLPANPESENGFVISARASRKGQYHLVETAELSQSGSSINSQERKEKSRTWEVVKEKLLYLGVFILVAGLLTLITYYHWTKGDIHHGFEYFMDSGGFGVRFMMTALGVALKMFWGSLDQDLRRIEPYRRLLFGSSNSTDSILTPTYMSPFSALLPSLSNHHFLIAHVALLSILSEFLPICLANIAFNAATTKLADDVCHFITLSVLSIMLITLIVLVSLSFGPRGKVRRLPRKPDTVASVLVYLTNDGVGKGGLLDSVRGLEKMATRQRDDVIRSWECLYGIGAVEGGSLRIDQEGRIERLLGDPWGAHA